MSKLIYRQGDALLRQVDDKDVDLATVDVAPVDARGLVLAEGETSGHHHAVFGSGAKLFRFRDATARQLLVTGERGPFCAWSDGCSLFSVHGIRVPEWLITSPERLTVDRIHAETNEEVRRVMIERYGMSKYVRDAQFEVLDADLDQLGYSRRLLRRGETMVVELTNSTTDADGKRRMYHVPVHPELRPLLSDTELGEPQKLTALNAVASTYGMRGSEYVLAAET
jgi:hypothetical protein